MTAAAIAQALGGRRSGVGYMACCPAHHDKTPSLSLRDAGGKVLLHCHAGCEQSVVVEALRSRGLWDGGGSAWAEWRDGIRYPVKWGTPIGEYRYTDQAGEFLYSVVRFEPKSFRPGYYDGGRWIWRKHPRQVLYRQPEVAEAPIIFLVEGERDVEALRNFGFVATTNAGGAEAPWLPEYTETLRGREVIVIPDRDVPGRKRAAQIVRALWGHVARLIVLDLEHDGKDVSDWFAAGHSELELIGLVEGEGVTR